MKKLEEIIGVKLFERSSNHLELTETGKFAAKLASEMLKGNASFASRVQAYDRSLRTISLISCATAPVFELTPRLQQLYPGMMIQTNVRTEEGLLNTLDDGSFQLAVTHFKPDNENLYFVECGHESLSITVPKEHPLASRDSIYFSDLKIYQSCKLRKWDSGENL